MQNILLNPINCRQVGYVDSSWAVYFSSKALQSILLPSLLFPFWGGRGSMRNDFRYLHNSLGFSALIACPTFFMITSSAFSPICLQNRIQYKNLKPIIWFRKGSKSPGHQEQDWILKCDKGFPFQDMEYIFFYYFYFTSYGAKK